ncbi:single-stranded DNA-binding protein [Micrococcus endophyticus]|uniref:single-stranded DNA-binding protein n=1 Tax=Micrococcus endophyticus TaxID=455343 RepID=UPI0035A94319
MQDIITVRGFVATDPVTRTTASGATVAGFRLATTERRFDREAGAWVDAHTNWYSVSAFGQLGSNTAQSVRKGNPVIVTGRLRVRDWSTEERSGTTVDVVADAVGLDLAFGSAAFQRSQRAAAARPEGADEQDGQGQAGAVASAGAAEADGTAAGTGDGYVTELPPALRGGDAPATPPPPSSEEGDEADEADDDAHGVREPAAAGTA